MKSSRLSPAGRPCMLGSRLEDTGCASCSFACTLPPASRWGPWGCPGEQEHPSPFLPGAAAASPPGKRAGRSAGGRGSRDRSGRWARLDAQQGRGRPRGRAGRQGPESKAAGGVWGSDLNCEPGLCWGEVEMPATPSLTPASALCPAARHGDTVAPCPRGWAVQEAVPGGATEGPPGARWFPRCLPGPHCKAGVRKGQAGWLAGATQSFQRHFQGVGSELLCKSQDTGQE